LRPADVNNLGTTIHFISKGASNANRNRACKAVGPSNDIRERGVSVPDLTRIDLRLVKNK
jgi:hypothetical protein